MFELLPYQAEGVSYALERRGAIIADEMGLGKTIQAIGLINADPSAKRILIVCPVGLKLNWSKELDAHITRKDGVNISIIGYTECHKVNGASFDLLIVDEAHYIKNADTIRSKEVMRLAKQAARVLLLTGTPFENRVAELWPLLCIADPEYWNPQRASLSKMRALPASVVLTSGSGPSPIVRSASERNEMRFKMRYCDPKKKEFWRAGRKRTAYEFKGGSNLEELNAKLRESCMIRRLKKDVLPQLPSKRREIVVFPNLVQESPLFLSEFQDITIGNYDEIVAKLRANKVAFAEWSRTRAMQAMAKMPDTIEHISRTLEHVNKVIVFAHHEAAILELRTAFPDAVCVTGAHDVSHRQNAVEAFQKDGRVRVFIGSIRAAGVGLTLTAASTVIFAEIDPNPGIMNQAEDRAHRIGQKDSVLVQYLVSDNSIDARLCHILVKKQDLLSRGLG